MTTPLLACVGPAQHGVRLHAQHLASSTPQAPSLTGTVDELMPRLVAGTSPVHLHFTDRIFGASPALAARAVAEIAAVRPVSATLHDIPQPSDGHAFGARRAAYAEVVQAARTVIVCSASEREQLRRHVPCSTDVSVVVDPLPVDPPEPEQWREARRRAAGGGEPTVGVLGFLYPGKGHDRVVQALTDVPGPVEVLALGRASDGHEDLVPALDAQARHHGHFFRARGFLDDAALTRAAQQVTVPVVAPSHVSASGSVGRWIASGRRPLVTPHPFFEELAERAPWALTLISDLDASLARALEDPLSTWIHPDEWRAADLPSTARAAAVQWVRVAGERPSENGAGSPTHPTSGPGSGVGGARFAGEPRSTGDTGLGASEPRGSRAAAAGEGTA
ncbi:hypothetical protein [Kocuria tytonicola]|uniref:hypothetical protein n=1 Tax=Kocuria tytonicola TaxID=2055946 RepID=UPI001A9E096A|nr:hypothetical protein [Kocuria tytonicola]